MQRLEFLCSDPRVLDIKQLVVKFTFSPCKEKIRISKNINQVNTKIGIK
jgi:hypothetical protein